MSLPCLRIHCADYPRSLGGSDAGRALISGDGLAKGFDSLPSGERARGGRLSPGFTSWSSSGVISLNSQERWF